MRQTIAIAIVLTAGAVLGGCGGGAIVSQSNSLGPTDDSAQLLDVVSAQPTVSEDQALQGILLMLDGRDDTMNFHARVAQLRSRGIAASSWDFSQARPLTRGRLAYMAYQASGMSGGVITTLTGPSQRYCLRELQYRQMMADGPLYIPATGMEFVAVLSRAHAVRTSGEFPIVLQTRQMSE